MNGGDMGGAKAKERRCSAVFCGGPSNICTEVADHMVQLCLSQKFLLKLQEEYFRLIS